MQQVAILNGTSRYDGIFATIRDVYSVLKMTDMVPRWYQFVDPGHGKEYPDEGIKIDGCYFPDVTLEMGLNRLLVFPLKSRKIHEDFALLSDPTLLYLNPQVSKLGIFVHDLRPLTNYSDNHLTTLMFRLILHRLRRTDLLIVHTDHLRKVLVGMQVPEDRIAIIPPSVSWSEDRQKAINHIERSIQKLKSENSLDILYVATDRPYKNLDFFLDLALECDRLKAKGDVHCELRFHIVSKLQKKTERRLASMKSHNITLHENVADIEAIYQQSDILLFPSLFEGFGRPIIEAMSLGLPVLANRLQPIIEIVGSSDMMAEVNNVQEWIEKLLRLTSPSHYRMMAQRSMERYQYYSWSNFQKRVASAMEKEGTI